MGNVYFTTLDFTNAYRQISLEQKTSEQGNFSLVDGKLTGTFCFKNEIYELTSMPAEFRKVIDNLFMEIPHANAFIDDIQAYCNSGKNFEEVRRIKRFLETTEMRICKNRV